MLLYSTQLYTIVRQTAGEVRIFDTDPTLDDPSPVKKSINSKPRRKNGMVNPADLNGHIRKLDIVFGHQLPMGRRRLGIVRFHSQSYKYNDSYVDELRGVEEFLVLFHTIYRSRLIHLTMKRKKVKSFM